MKVPILMYHSIGETSDPRERRYCCSIKNFSHQMQYLADSGYYVASLDNLAHALNTGLSLPRKPVVITFDDGFKDTFENAFPILKKYNYTATIFIISGLVGKVNQWMENGGYPKRELMEWHEIEEMQKNGITIGSHTVNHYHLSHLRPEDVKREVELSKKTLENRLGKQIDHFAYPYGDINGSIGSILEETGYKTACSIRSGFNSVGIDPFTLKRIAVHGTDSLWQFALKLIYGTNKANILLPIKYYMSRLKDKALQ